MSPKESERATLELQHHVGPVSPRNFYIFGQGISFSMSPAIHGAGFRYYCLPHVYEIHQTKSIEELSALIFSPQFGGASVTMPHKVIIKKYCSSVTEHARLIGAINTLITEGGGNIRGDNTDWTGLVSVLRDKSRNISKRLETGLVIGAGGASRAALYAMFQMDIKNIYLFNRTKAKAGVIALDFSEFFKITVLDSLDDLLTPGFVAPDVIIGTIPADKTTIASFPKILWANPEGICVDMSYKPRLTPLLECTMKYRESENGWSTVTGIEVLLEQAFDQFRLWTGREAPKEEMKRAVLEKRDGQVLVFEAQGRALI